MNGKEYDALPKGTKILVTVNGKVREGIVLKRREQWRSGQREYSVVSFQDGFNAQDIAACFISLPKEESK